MSDTDNVPLEDWPIRAALVKGIKLVVLIKDIKSGRRIKEKRIEWDDPEDRRYLGKLTYQAIINNQSIETMNEKDYIVEE